MLSIKKYINFNKLSIICSSLLIISCSAVTIDEKSPADIHFKEGERLLNKNRYLEAIDRFRVLKNRYPYSIYATEATLKIADSYFAQESYIEAAGAYAIFRELYPKHKKIDYAIYRTGLSKFNLVPDTNDRDLSEAKGAIREFNQLLKRFPESKFSKDAANKRRELFDKLAQKEAYVADFYFKREHYQSAIQRYKQILQNYSNMGLDEISLYRLAFSYKEKGEKDKALETIDRLSIEYPESSYLSKANSIKEQLKN